MPLSCLNCDKGRFQKQNAKNEKIDRVLNVSMRKIGRIKKRMWKINTRLHSTAKNEIVYMVGKTTAILKPIWLR